MPLEITPPTPGGDEGTWGTELNAALGAIEDAVNAIEGAASTAVQPDALISRVAVVTYSGDLAAARPTAAAVYWVDFPSTPTNAQSQDIVAGTATPSPAAADYAHLEVVPGTVPPNASSVASTMAYQAGVLYNVRIDAGVALGNFMEWEVGPLAAGTYTLRTVYLKGTNAGITTVSVDGVDHATKIDQYGTFAANNVADLTVTLTAGRHKIRYRAAEKNAASSNYNQSLQGFSLTRTGA